MTILLTTSNNNIKMRVTFIYLFNLDGNHFEDTTDHTEISEMCLEADGDDSDVDIDIM